MIQLPSCSRNFGITGVSVLDREDGGAEGGRKIENRYVGKYQLRKVSANSLGFYESSYVSQQANASNMAFLNYRNVRNIEK